MPLTLSPVILSDFDTIVNHAKLYSPGDDLVAPPVSPLCWPVKNEASAHRRLKFNMCHQQARFLHEPSARFMKVSDSETGEIVSLARWHYYPEGYHYERDIKYEVDDLVPEDIEECGGKRPEEFNMELYTSFVYGRMSEREKWQEKGRACWILMNMITRESHRGRGAASILIDWGVKRAEIEHVPAYLEASALGRPVYLKHGFEQIGDSLPLDMKPFGLDLVFVLVRMAKFPPDFKRETDKVLQ